MGQIRRMSRRRQLSPLQPSDTPRAVKRRRVSIQGKAVQCAAKKETCPAKKSAGASRPSSSVPQSPVPHLATSIDSAALADPTFLRLTQNARSVSHSDALWGTALGFQRLDEEFGKWRPARVLKVTQDEQFLLVRYVGWGSKTDAWLRPGDSRLRAASASAIPSRKKQR